MSAALIQIGQHTGEGYKVLTEAAQIKRNSSDTASSFDTQIAREMGSFFDETFLYPRKQLVAAGLCDKEVKRLVRVPSTWGTKSRGKELPDSAAEFLGR